jgi:Zn-dependent protease with chaperone function
MNRFAWIFVGCCLLVIPAGIWGSGQSPSVAAPLPQTILSTPPQKQVQPSEAMPTTYTLSPERRAQAIAYSRIRYLLYFLGTAISLGIYILIWRTGLATLFRDMARRVSRRLIFQCLIFIPLFLAAATLLNLPLDFYSGYLLMHRFGLSTQGLASWFGDWAKGLAIAAALGVVVAWIFYTVVRRSPRRWWFYFWMASIPLVLAFILIQPYVIDPLFYRFTPLDKTQPALVEKIEAMLDHAGIFIPPKRIFEMDASSRTRELNAYVSGLGSSKRVVIWDTTLKTMTQDQMLLVLGHETGHYALNHIPKEFALDEGVALIFFIVGFFAVNWLVKKGGPRSLIEGVGDLASLPLVLSVLTILTLFSAPIVNGISRYYEHQADQFGLEVAYGIVPDPNAAMARAMQILGEIDLSDPNPSPFIRFWLYSHPPLDERIRFAATYKPWAEGKPLELLPRRR